jgi:hypothetical protein
LFAILARHRADTAAGLNLTLMAETSMAAIWDDAMRGMWHRWRSAAALGTTAEFVKQLRAKLESVPRGGRRDPLYTAATVALLCEIGELARDRFNGTCLCWADDETQTLTAEGAAGGPQWMQTLMQTATRLGCRLEVRP